MKTKGAGNIRYNNRLCGDCAKLLYQDPIGRGLCERNLRPMEQNTGGCKYWEKCEGKTKQT